MDLRVLTVDDSEPQRRWIVRRLSRIEAGLKCFEAHSVPSATEALANNPDLVLLDLQLLPKSTDRSGLTLLDHIRETRPRKTFVAVLSCHDDTSTQLTALKAGADTFVAKDELSIPKLRELLDLATKKTRALPDGEDLVRYVQKLGQPLPDAMRVAERDIIETVVTRAGGSADEAAKELGISARTLRRRRQGSE